VFLHFFIAQSTGGNGAGEIIKNAQTIAREIDIAMSGTFIDTLKGPLYKEVCTLGAGVLLFAGLFGLAAVLRSEMHKQAFTPLIPVEKIIVIFILVLLLGAPVNRGKALGELSLFSHRQFQTIGNNLLGNISAGIESDVAQQAQTKLQWETLIPGEVEKCLTINDLPKRDFCLQRLDDRIRGETESYSQAGWAKQLYDRWHSEINGWLSENTKEPWDPLGDIGKGLSSAAGGIGQGVAYLVIQGVLVAIGSGFIYADTQVTLISYLVLPVFLGLALFSEEYTAAKVGLGGVAALEGASILYKILNANIALTVLNSPPNDPLLMPVVLAGLAIGLSLALIGGGGLGIFQIFASLGGRALR
jgi:hypothetical protein